MAAVQAEVRRRAAQRRGVAARPAAPTGAPTGAGSAGAAAGAPRAAGALRPSTAVRRLPPAHTPAPTSTRLGVSFVKRVVLRLTAWQVRPLAQDLDALRTATVRSLEAVEAELAAQRAAREPAPAPGEPTG